MKSVSFRRYRSMGQGGFAHHLILPFIAVLAVCGIGYLTLHLTHAATTTSYYGAACATKDTYANGANGGSCVKGVQELLDGLQHAKYKVNGKLYVTTTKVAAGETFAYGTSGGDYLIFNGIYKGATEGAITTLTGDKAVSTLNAGTSSGDDWQILCTDIAKSGIQLTANKNSGPLNFGGSNNMGTTTMVTVFNSVCGSVTKATTTTTGGGGGSGTSGGSSSGAPTARLGVFVSAEDNGAFSTVSGQKPDIGNTYLYWNSTWPSQFVSGAEAAGATPFIELEPWTGSESGAPQFSDITSGKYDTWLESLGSSVKALNKPVIFTFAHEFNVSGQYPWAQGDKGSCGSSSCTPAQWIAAWDYVEAKVNSTAGGHAYWMWAPGADTGGTTETPVAYWPGSSEVQMVGVDGYPDTQYGSQFGSFSGEFGPVFKEIKTKTTLPIFIAETDLEPLGSSGYETIPNFIKDLFAAGGTGVLEWEDGSPKMSSAQWSQLDTALAAYPN